MSSRDRTNTGKSQPGTRPTIRTIAAAAGVSTATVSYVLNRRDLSDSKITITAATRERVLAAASELGYSPNQSARGMSRGRTDQICLVIDDFDSPWTQAIVAAVRSAAETLDKTSLMLLDHDWFEFLSRQGADAAVISGGAIAATDESRIRQLAERGVQLILLHSPLEPAGFDVIRQSVRRSLDQAMATLLPRHDRIGLLRRAIGEQAEVENAYREAIGEDHVDPALIRDIDASRDHAYWQSIDLLTMSDRPTAILASNDLSAISALHAAHRLHINIPDELEIIGFGNSPEGQRTDPALSSVGAEAIADQIAELLIHRLRGDDEPAERLHINEFSLYLRGTTRQSTTRKRR
ncbi:MAG TPA: LacI family DNA-binding transcriptional regulator [Microlunatus sp.]